MQGKRLAVMEKGRLPARAHAARKIEVMRYCESGLGPSRGALRFRGENPVEKRHARRGHA
ncbi:hypothetical protein [Paraburkholderia sp. Cy-641]|uniref:hypothetical protein n=1 Tax=Paraburkholderia sp. Cy-641 TaxID=2608337 RepID=UPI0019647DC4|nr:hypothetical protein [Paraburkholderia sp. Cy-641]